mmetsp:Transcript_106589/g.306625  ORF Transcript_106589/g.306625 Transcript_106589/m.306625 type:complete len:257 (-) Transcript_106589:285-1055(-)
MATDGEYVKKPRGHPRRRVAIYGGAFDPITNSHMTCASEIVHSGKADEVWLVPCGKRPDKPKLKTPPLDRYVMCQIAVNSSFSPSFPVRVSDVECFEQEAMFTYDLLCKLREANPEFDFSFVIGTDWLQNGTNIASWESKNPAWKPGDPLHEKFVVTGDKLLQEFDFLVVKRPGFEVVQTAEDPTGLKTFGPRLQWLSMEHGMTFIEGNLSSTELRKRMDVSHRIADAAENNALHTIEGLVPTGVLSYIGRAGLYR